MEEIIIEVALALGLKIGGKILDAEHLRLWGALASQLADQIPAIVGRYGTDVQFMSIDFKALEEPLDDTK